MAHSGMPVMGVLQTAGEHGDRMMGASSVNPNTFATNLLVGLFIVVGVLFVTQRFWLRVLCLAALGVLLLAVLMSLSRAVSLVLVVSVVFMVFRFRHRVPIPYVLALLLLVIVCITPFVPAAYFERMGTLFTHTRTDASLVRRSAYHMIGSELFLRSPIWGVGPGSFPSYYQETSFRFLADTFEGGRRLHNMYLTLACELGGLGLLTFGAIIWATFRSLGRVIQSYGAGEDAFLRQAAETLQLCLFAFLLNSIFLSNEYLKYLWVLVATAAALANMRRRELGLDYSWRPANE
jgi:O-antigen ligase